MATVPATTATTTTRSAPATSVRRDRNGLHKALTTDNRNVLPSPDTTISNGRRKVRNIVSTGRTTGRSRLRPITTM